VVKEAINSGREGAAVNPKIWTNQTSTRNVPGADYWVSPYPQKYDYSVLAKGPH
jgi:hypothetical protein